jgi:hypothetical protein
VIAAQNEHRCLASTLLAHLEGWKRLHGPPAELSTSDRHQHVGHTALDGTVRSSAQALLIVRCPQPNVLA